MEVEKVRDVPFYSLNKHTSIVSESNNTTIKKKKKKKESYAELLKNATTSKRTIEQEKFENVAKINNVTGGGNFAKGNLAERL